MATVFVVKTEIVNINKDNIFNKLKPHFDEVTKDLLYFGLPHVRAITRVEKLSDTTVQMITDILDRSR
jgi:hypothetical protein